MAITYTGTNGLFTRLGKLFYVIEQMNSFTDTLRAEVEDVIDEFTVADIHQLMNLPAQLKTIETPLAPLYGQLSAVAANIVIETVKSGLEKNPKSLREALEMLIDDMVTETKHVEDVNYSTSGTIAAVSGNTANVGTVLHNAFLSKKITTGGTQYVIQTLRPEKVLIECIKDESGGAVLGKELFRVTGEEHKNYTDADWPAGSGARKLVRVTSAKDTGVYKTNTPGENILVNSDFQLFTSSLVPTRWSVGQMDSHSVPANAQTQNTTAGYIWNSESAGNLKITGDGTYRHRITQDLGTGTGTPGRVYAGGNYTFSCRIRIAAGSGTVGGGEIRFSIQNGSGSVTSATKSYALSSVGTTWIHVSESMDLTGIEIPTDARFAIECTTAVPNTKSIVIDELILTEGVQVYPGGYRLTVLRGQADYRTGDAFTVTWAHSASPPVNEFQFMFEQLFGMSQYNLNLPVHTSENIADSLIA